MDLTAESRREAELQLAEELKDEEKQAFKNQRIDDTADRDRRQPEAVDSWWDYESIEIEEKLLPEENSLHRGFELDSDARTHHTRAKGASR